MPLLVLSARDAFRRAAAEHSRWPGRLAGQMARLRPMARPVLAPSFRFGPSDPVFTIGSCFARNIEKQLLIEGYNVAYRRFSLPPEPGAAIDPDLMLHRYVPQSIANELAWALGEEPFPEAFYYQEDGGWRDLQLHIGAPAAPLETIRARRQALTDYMRLACEARVFVMTVGLAEAWFDRETGLYLNTAPPASARSQFKQRFEFHLLGPDEILAGLERIHGLLTRHGRPGLQILATVSPVALNSTFTGDDILLANTYMKSALRTATEVFARSHDRVDYFPSYESVTLSDPRRAWAEDQAHVTDEIVRRNVLLMLEAYGEPTPARGRALEALKAYDQLQLAREALAWDREDKALDLYRAAAAAAPEDAVVLVEAGRFLMKRRRWAEASRLLEAALEHGGEHYTGWYWLARIRHRQHRYAAAWEAAQEARRREPQHTPVLNFCADLATRLGKLDEALACAEEHARLEPGSASSQARLKRLRARRRPSIGGRIRAWASRTAT